MKIKQNTKSDLNIKSNENVKKSVPTSHGGPSTLEGALGKLQMMKTLTQNTINDKILSLIKIWE